VGDFPRHVYFSTDGKKIFFVNTNNQSGISVIDVGTGKIVSAFAINGVPTHLAIAPDGRKIYVLVSGSRSIFMGTVDVQTGSQISKRPFQYLTVAMHRGALAQNSVPNRIADL
jgi:DNA-binding beta-propeller fold protein YncE